jgi:hypothetical protein
LAACSDIRIRHSSPASVRSVSVSNASGLEFSDATTTAPVHATMPGNIKTDMSEQSSKQTGSLFVLI